MEGSKDSAYQSQSSAFDEISTDDYEQLTCRPYFRFGVLNQTREWKSDRKGARGRDRRDLYLSMLLIKSCRGYSTPIKEGLWTPHFRASGSYAALCE